MSRDYFMELSRGNINGGEGIIVIGHNTDIDTASEEDMWEQGGTKIYLSSAETMDVVSTSTDDDVGGIGATSILIKGLDENYLEVSETVTLDGTSVVTTSQTFLRINQVTAVDSGSSLTNVGNISLTSTTSSHVQSLMLAGEGISHDGFYTVPANKVLFLLGTELNTAKSVGGGKPVVEFMGRVRFVGDYGSGAPWTQIFDKKVGTENANSWAIIPPIFDRLPEKSELRIVGATDTNNTDARSRVYGALFDA